MVQLDLLFSHTDNTLLDYLERETGKNVSLTVTDNSTSMISVKAKGDLISLRLHRMFLRAGSEVIRELAEFVKRRKGSTPLIRKFIRENQDSLKDAGPRQMAIRTDGKYHNLRELFDLVNDEYFGGKIDASISWGKKVPRWAVRKRTLGSYSYRTNTIWINPVLDRRNVPKYVVQFVIYHEMLHCDIPPEKIKCRRLVHSPEFRRRERLFEQYERAVLWEHRH